MSLLGGGIRAAVDMDSILRRAYRTGPAYTSLSTRGQRRPGLIFRPGVNNSRSRSQYPLSMKRHARLFLTWLLAAVAIATSVAEAQIWRGGYGLTAPPRHPTANTF